MVHNREGTSGENVLKGVERNGLTGRTSWNLNGTREVFISEIIYPRGVLSE